MEKSPEAFRTISEVADLLDTPAHVLRFWESRFPQVRPVKRAGGRRYYRPTDVALLAGIRHLLHDQGMTIRGVQKILRDHGVRHVSGLIAGGDEAGMPDAVAEPQDTAPDSAEAWPDAEHPEADDRRVIPWPGNSAPDEGQREIVPDEGAAAPEPGPVIALADAGDAPAGADQPAEAADPSAGAPAALARVEDAPTTAEPPSDASAAAIPAPAAPVQADPPPPETPLSDPVPGSAPAVVPPPGAQGELFADLPQVRPPAPAPVVIEPAEAGTPAEPVVVPPPASADAAPADTRALANRIRHLPPGAVSTAGLAPLLARLADLRDRMHAPPRF
jgi:resuscitation-promoting factor RpfA